MTAKQPFDVVVARHGATVLRVCRAVVGTVDADDAWSETFIAALRAYPDLPAAANVEAWLVTIAHRKAIDLVRGAARRPAPTPVSPANDAHNAVTADHAAAEADDTLLAALRQLPARQQHAVVYHHLGGLPYRDVAEIMGGNAAAARRAAADGISSLRRLLTAAPVERNRA